ncbi:MAG: Flp pilus assembly protein CpaB [Myxococcales bacterium]|nr:Flp pilus assembly protein CpaB [Myxococcales bacterium]MCB9707395.1 Flp pilus assembly protein CpaB [Myxococcales bacterium]
MNTKALGIAVILAGLGTGALLLYMKKFEQQASGGAPVAVVFATREIPMGSVVKEDMLGVRAIPESYVEDRHIRASDAARIIGVRVQTGLKPSESLLWSDLATSRHNRDLSSLVQSGMRAITISATQTSTFGGLLRPGDRVDILFSDTAKDSHDTTRPLIQNVLVLAAGSETGKESMSRNRSFNQVTVSASREQAQLLAHAKNRGTLTLILRNPNDIKIAQDVPETSNSDLENTHSESIDVTPSSAGSNKEIEHVN